MLVMSRLGVRRDENEYFGPTPSNDSPNASEGGPDGFSSRHTGGANFLYGDGSVRFVKDGVSRGAFRAFATAAGGEIIQDY